MKIDADIPISTLFELNSLAALFNGDEKGIFIFDIKRIFVCQKFIFTKSFIRNKDALIFVFNKSPICWCEMVRLLGLEPRTRSL